MRAGSLSDPRVVAVLRKYFVCVHVPELCTEELIRLDEDRRWFKALDARLAGDRPHGPFYGGVREAFFAPDRTPINRFATLYPGDFADSQLVRRTRARPDAAVTKFFRHAAAAMRAVHDDLPADWPAFVDGTAPEVEAVRRLPIPDDPPGTVRAWVRNDRLMYEGLVGGECITLSSDELRRLVPDPPTAGASTAWPRELFVRIARACYPRGEVWIALEDASIHGLVETRVTHRADGHVYATLDGTLRLEPQTARERGRRASCLAWARTSLRGEIVVDMATDRVTRLRIVGDGQVNFQGSRFSRTLPLVADDDPAKAHAVEHRNVSPNRYGLQPWAIAIEYRAPPPRSE